MAAAGSLACLEMNPTTGTGVQIFRGRTPTMSYLSFSGSMSLSMSMPISMSPSSSRLEVLVTLFVAVGEMPRAARAKLDLTLRGHLVGDAKFVKRFPRPLARPP